jgi:hypothetical protein
MIKKKANNIFRKKMLYKRVPILTWLPKYTTEDAIGDAIAGVTVGEFKYARNRTILLKFPPSHRSHSHPTSSRLCWNRKSPRSIWSLRVLPRLFRLHFPRLLQGRADGTNSNRLATHISSGTRQLAQGYASVLPLRLHRATNGSLWLGLSDRFRFGTCIVWLHECGGFDHFHVASARHFWHQG